MSALSYLFWRRLTGSILLVWFALAMVIVLFDFFRLSGDFSVAKSAGLALLNTPRFLLDTLPFAAAIGATIAIQKATESNEIIALRCAGLSPLKIWQITLSISLIFVLASLLISEWLLPHASQGIKNLRHQSNPVGYLWLNKDNHYIRIKEVLDDGTMRGILIYTTKDGHIAKTRRADRAETTDNQWTLFNVTTFYNTADGLKKQTEQQISWQGIDINPADLNNFVDKPRTLSTWQAFWRAQKFAQIGQNNESIKEVILQRLLMLLGLPFLVSCCLWFISQSSRKKSVAIPIFISTCTAALFFFLSQVAAKFSILTDSNWLLPVPLILLIAFVLVGIKRQC